MNIESFKKLPVMGIIRGVEEDAIEPLAESVISAGLKTVEIAMNTKGAARLIEKMVKVSGKRLFVGAGTVLREEGLKAALDSGATFIVMPVLVRSVVDYCVKGSIPVFPGAFTPQEIYNAASAGATMVKVFPAKFFGPDYIKEIKGPFQDIELLACGGVNPDNIGAFFSAGASAVAFGGSIFKKEWLSAKKFQLIEKSVKSLLDSYRLNLK